MGEVAGGDPWSLQPTAYRAATLKATGWITAIISAQHGIQDRWLIQQSKLSAGTGGADGSGADEADVDEVGLGMDDIDLSSPVRVYADPDAVLKQGGLKKVAYMKKIWQTRFFVLKCHTLDYFADASCTALKGTVEIKNIVGIVPAAGGGAAVDAICPDCGANRPVSDLENRAGL